MKQPRMLRTHLQRHYIHKRGESNEHGLFAEGLFNSMGWDEFFLPFEGGSDAAQLAKDSGPYDAAFFMPYQQAPIWIRDIVGPDVPIICWIPDDIWRFDFTRQLIDAGAADHYVTTCAEALPRYAAAGMGHHVTLSAFGCRPDWWPKLVTRPDTPALRATFTGLLYGERLARLKEIAAAGKVPIDGYDTQQDVTPIAEYHQRMADAAFTLCLTASSHGVRQHKARLFEPQLHGSILVTEADPLESWQTTEAVIFDDARAAQEAMTYLLDHSVEYQAMAERALTRAVTEQSFQARFAVVFDALGLPYTMPDFSALLGDGDGSEDLLDV